MFSSALVSSLVGLFVLAQSRKTTRPSFSKFGRKVATEETDYGGKPGHIYALGLALRLQ